MRLVAVLTVTLATIPFAPTAGLADACGPRLIVEFREGGPDHFILQNASDPGWSVQRVELDLGQAHGGLIFDVTETGAGVSAHQPYGEAGGTAVLVTRTEVADGDSLLSLAFGRFVPGERYRFTVDLDDTRPDPGQTWIADHEIDGALVRAVFTNSGGGVAEREARFEADSRADTGRGEACLIS